MVDNNGKPIKDGWIGLRGKKVAQQLTRKYNLIPAEGKHLDKTHLEAMSQSEVNRYKIYQAIVDSPWKTERKPFSFGPDPSNQLPPVPKISNGYLQC
jgi:hypothetical protein